LRKKRLQGIAIPIRSNQKQHHDFLKFESESHELSKSYQQSFLIKISPTRNLDGQFILIRRANTLVLIQFYFPPLLFIMPDQGTMRWKKSE